MPTSLPARRPLSTGEPMVTFLLGTSTVVLLAIVLSLAVLPHTSPPTAHDVQLQVAIGIPP